MYLTQAIKSNAQQQADAIATRFGARTQTWRSFTDRVARLAAGLASLGVQRGDRVAILALNSDRYLEYYYGCYWLGAVVVPMNLRWSPAENAYSLNDSGAQTLFVDDVFLKAMPAILAEAKGVRHFVFTGEGETPEGWHRHDELIAAHEPAEDAGAGGHDLAGIFYTGGTTGFPKGVMLSHLAIWSSGMAMAFNLGCSARTNYLHAAPMFHLADGAMSNCVTVAGGSHSFIAAFDPAKVLDAIEQHAVTDVLLVPTMVQMLLNAESYSPARLASLQRVIYGASPMPEGVIRRCLTELPEVGFAQAYGQTELAPLATINPPEQHVLDGPNSQRLRSAGRACACVELKIVGDDGQELPRGQVGEVIVRGPNTMTGYWKLPEQTAATLKNGWVHTGDAAWMDDEGYIYIADRLKDMIISGGENVFSAEVESAISKHPAVREVAVVGIPSEQWGESVHAIIVPHADAKVSEQEIIEHSKGLIAHYKCPRSVEFRREPLPLSGAGKVLKRDLRAPYWEGRERQVN
ncbi:MAG: long-chain-fatty-acid--CoA ligase [Burkholderiaceae bacterium]